VLLIDPADRAGIPDLLALGVSPVVVDILMPDHAREVALAQRLLEAGGA
jgi:hypothetical protein